MKKFILTENQFGILKEFIQDGFDLDVLDSLSSKDVKVRYCQHYLGKPIGRGCDRLTFDLTDDKVLKFAYNNEIQNKNEYLSSCRLNKKYDLFTKVYEAAEDFSWIICERVVPFRPIDSDVILGIPYSAHFRDSLKNKEEIMNKKKGYYYPYVSDFYNFQSYGTFDDEFYNTEASFTGFLLWARYYAMGKEDKNSEKTKLYMDLMFKNPNKERGEWFQKIYMYIEEVNGMADLWDENFGIAMRNGKPTIVILDCGADELS